MAALSERELEPRAASAGQPESPLTTGLPGFHEHEWELAGVICLVLGAGFVAVAARALTTSAPGRRAVRA